MSFLLLFSPLIQPLLEHIVAPAVVGAITAGSAWVFTKIPGPARDWLQSDTHAKEVSLVTGAMSRAAVVAVAGNPVTAAGILPTAAIEGVIGYVQKNLPDTLEKLKPSPEALVTMATAAITKAFAEAK